MAITFEEALSRGRLRPFQWATFAVCMLVLVGDGIDLQLLGLVAPVITAAGLTLEQTLAASFAVGISSIAGALAAAYLPATTTRSVRWRLSVLPDSCRKPEVFRWQNGRSSGLI